MRYSATTSATPPDVIRMARGAFGPTGTGLRLAQQELLAARFEGQVGFVRVEAERMPDGTTEVVVETRELDAEVRRFLAGLPRQSLCGALRARMRGKT
jgi:hypothetical protein